MDRAFGPCGSQNPPSLCNATGQVTNAHSGVASGNQYRSHHMAAKPASQLFTMSADSKWSWLHVRLPEASESNRQTIAQSGTLDSIQGWLVLQAEQTNGRHAC